MTIALIVIGLITTGTIISIFWALKAPVGYEDEIGFHFRGQSGHQPNPAFSEEFSNPFNWRLFWKPGLGLTALLLLLLFVSTEYHNSENSSSSSVEVIKQVPGRSPQDSELTSIRTAPSKLSPTLCHRFSRIE